MVILQSINLALRFLLEICVLIAVGYWGFSNHAYSFTKILFGIGCPLGIAVVWALFGAPASKWQAHGILLLLLELFIFGAAVVALYAAGRSNLAGAIVALFAINRLLMYVWGQ